MNQNDIPALEIIPSIQEKQPLVLWPKYQVGHLCAAHRHGGKQPSPRRTIISGRLPPLTCVVAGKQPSPRRTRTSSEPFFSHPIITRTLQESESQ